MTTTGVPPEPPLLWSPCGPLQCATLRVPLDYSRPGGARITIAVARQPARVPSQRLGSLVINPGGPGDSGIDDLSSELAVLTPEVRDRFDIVSFDPRGVARSDPISCQPPGTPAAPADQALLADPVPQTPLAQLALLQGDRSYAEACRSRSGPLLGHVGTAVVVDDLEELRLALGDPGLTFFGHSYGTYLGALYAQAFPTHVRAMVLDGAIDPALSFDAYVAGQADGFEHAADQFFTWCGQAPSCPWRGAGEQALLDLSQRLRADPVPAGGGRDAGVGELYEALLGALYNHGSWPSLAEALAAASAGQGARLVAMSDRYMHHGGSNSVDAFNAVTCLDHPANRDPRTYGPFAARLSQGAPLFGPLFAWGELLCAVWPEPPTSSPSRVSAPGSPPILVVGSTGDPATPYQWAVSLAGQLSSGRLLSFRGDVHVAYYYSSCVRSWVGSYLVGGSVPPAGSVCSS